MGKRLYIVNQKNAANESVGETVVEASTAAEAIRTVTVGMFEAKPATPMDIARITGVNVTKRKE